MADPASGPEADAATGGASPGEAALRAAIDEHGEDVAGLIERSEEVGDLVDTVVLVLASADDEDVASLAATIAALVRTAAAAGTDETVALADFVGEQGDDAASTFGKLVALDRDGTLDDLLDLGTTLSGLDVDDGSVETANRLLAAVEAAETDAEPTGPLGALRALRGPDARAGIGYVVALLRSVGREVVGR